MSTAAVEEPRPGAVSVESQNRLLHHWLLGLLALDGYVLVPDADKADLVIINTCGFIEAARQESLGVIREFLDRKRAISRKGLFVV